MKKVGADMLQRHKCRIKEIDEKQVFNTKEVQDLYKQVFSASNEMDFLSTLAIEKRELIAHQETFSIKLQKNHFQLFLIPIYIHGKKYEFIVDTGAQISGVVNKHSDLVDKYKQNKKIPIKSISGNKREVESICIDTFYLGALEIKNQSFILLDKEDFMFPFIKKEIMEFDGIIGWDILSHFDFEIDTKKGVFSILKSQQMFTYCNLVHALFPVVIVYDENNKPALFGIDTGAKVSWLDESYCERGNRKVVKQKRGLQVGVLGVEKTKINIIKECQYAFYKTQIQLENIRTGDTQVFMNLKLDGIFGNEIFKGKTLQVLNSKGMMVIK